MEAQHSINVLNCNNIDIVVIIWSVGCTRTLQKHLKSRFIHRPWWIWVKADCMLPLMDTHTDTNTHLCRYTCTESRVRHPAWQCLCEALCGGSGLHFLLKALGTEVQRKCGALGRLQSRWRERMCSAARFNVVYGTDRGAEGLRREESQGDVLETENTPLGKHLLVA